MPRQSRVIIPNTPHHIVQRGHNRQATFGADDDFTYYKENLTDFKSEFGCKVYAYCLMTNHVHLVVDPGDKPESLSLLMKRVAGRQTRYVNRLEKRSGSLWEGRFKSSVISTQEYLLACCRYVELNPIRAAITDDPGSYRWSSYRCKTLDIVDKVVDFDQLYLALGDTETERQNAYKSYVEETIPELELKLIREAIQRGQLTGSERFRDQIEKKIGIRISNRPQGRPRKVSK